MTTLKLAEMGELLQLRVRRDWLEEELKVETQRRRNAERDLKFVAKFFCRNSEFLDWLLDQDVSSAHVRKPSGGVGVEVEGKDDVELAIEFCKWLDRQSQNPTS